MASQPRVGLLPERRAGNCTGYSDYPAATGSDLECGALLVSRVVENMAASLSHKSVALSISICGRGPLWSAFVDKTREV
jgi:hypothetical protein